MGLFNVPQFIDIEDKIVGPLTAKQLGWLGIEAVILLIAWVTLDFSALIVVAIVTGLPFGALAFYKPNGQPFGTFMASAFTFFLKPKIYIWRRVPDMRKSTHKPTNKKNVTISTAARKETAAKNIESLAQTLDSKSKS